MIIDKGNDEYEFLFNVAPCRECGNVDITTVLPQKKSFASMIDRFATIVLGNVIYMWCKSCHHTQISWPCEGKNLNSIGIMHNELVNACNLWNKSQGSDMLAVMTIDDDSDDELLPCNQCKADSDIVHMAVEPDKSFIFCEACGATTAILASEAHVFEAWNAMNSMETNA